MAGNRVEYNILVTEDNAGDFALVQELLSEHFEALNLIQLCFVLDISSAMRF
jgi:hypothetical protein